MNNKKKQKKKLLGSWFGNKDCDQSDNIEHFEFQVVVPMVFVFVKIFLINTYDKTEEGPIDWLIKT